MTYDIARLASSTGLIDRQARTASTSLPSVNLDGVTTLRSSSNSIADAFGMTSDDFMRLFLAQLQNQDPTQPMDDKQMLTELAQFTMISTLNSLNQALGGTQLAQTSALIGTRIIGTDTSGLPASGVVDRIVQDASGIMLVLEGGALVEPDQVTQVLAGPSSSTSTGSTATT
jgi:flagellar basal-body rod modification protein FlgD